MKLIVTIDAEEDNWARYSNTDNPVENIKRIVPLQQLFDRYGVKPTYLVTYPVATNLKSVAILKRILEEGKCEIGAHCHPWNNPPFEEELNNRNTMLCNLSEDLVFRKLCVLHEAIFKNFNMVPTSFRSGRWGFGSSVARALCGLGYGIDTSVTAYTNWNIYHGPDYSRKDPRPYRFSPSSFLKEFEKGELLEVPATVGFLQKNFYLSNMISLVVNHYFFRSLRMSWILRKINLLNKVYLSPEISNTEEMIALSRRMRSNGGICINLFFHSPSLLCGLTPFKKTNSQISLQQRLESFFQYSNEEGFSPLFLSEFER
jgi:hypothetical protein